MSGMRIAAIALGLLSLGGCGGTDSFEFAAMSGRGNWALLIPEGATTDELVTAAGDKCGNEDQCWVFGWTDRTQLATSLPMSDNQVETMAFSYRRNRFSGLDEFAVDCARFAKSDGINCL
jgi:hypothetical protein